MFNNLELCMEEAVERGFNCIRTEGGAGITHDAKAGRAGNWSSTRSCRAMIFNEVALVHGKTVDHEAALDFLQTRHPDIRFALKTSSPFIDPSNNH